MHHSPSRRGRKLLRTIGFSLATVLPFLATPSSPAAAASETNGTVNYQVTVAARVCNQYGDVFANRNRNNIMESLKNLGGDTPYNPFIQVLPSVEDGTAPQSSCQPLTGWKFAFGTGYSRPVPGTNLSYVNGTSNVGNRIVTTQASTPLLDQNGDPTGQNIAGASTFSLTPTELSYASRSSSLWVMGGTPSQPLGDQPDAYGFAALRCAMDNLNGDNVEWVGFPQNTTHVFCYAFYVQPPPTAGTITIVKKLAAPAAEPETFNFTGNISYNTNNDFKLTVPAGQTTASATFVRGETTAGEAPWGVSEDIPGNYNLTGLGCASAGASSYQGTGSSPNSLLPSGYTGMDITLAPADSVTCTFTNTIIPPLPSTLSVTKDVVVAGGGSMPPQALPQTFNVEATQPSASPPTAPIEIPLTVPSGANSSGASTVDNLSPGTWTLTENVPVPTTGWTWSALGATCDISPGTPVSSNTSSITITVPAGGGANCTFTNQVTPTGALTVRFTTHGGTGTFGAIVASGDGQLSQTATTVSPGVAQVAIGDSTDPLGGQWIVTPVAPADTSVGHWEPTGPPSCNVGNPVATNVGPNELEVQPSNTLTPNVVCDFDYNFVPASTLQVSKAVTGNQALRNSDVTITTTCDDGAAATLTLAPGQAGPVSLTTPLNIPTTTICHVAETANGGAPGAVVTTAATVSVNGVTSALDPSSFTINADQGTENVVVGFTNHYAATPGPGPGPGPTPVPGPNGGGGIASGGGGSSSGKQLAYTGARLDLLAGAGVLAVLLGTGLMLMTRRRSAEAGDEG